MWQWNSGSHIRMSGSRRGSACRQPSIAVAHVCPMQASPRRPATQQPQAWLGPVAHPCMRAARCTHRGAAPIHRRAPVHAVPRCTLPCIHEAQGKCKHALNLARLGPNFAVGVQPAAAGRVAAARYPQAVEIAAGRPWRTIFRFVQPIHTFPCSMLQHLCCVLAGRL